MNFLTMGDANYFSTIALSATLSARHYPGRSFLIYDWGFREEQRRQLAAMPGVTIIGWQDRFISAERAFHERSAFKRLVKRHLLRHPDARIPLRQWQREFILGEKCYCMVDAVSRTEGGLLFLDGDAFLVNRVDGMLNTDSDVVVTVRPREEILAARKRGSRHDINSGVVFFNRDKAKTTVFLIEWIKEMSLLNLKRHLLSEQTALSNLILRDHGGDIPEPEAEVGLRISDLSLTCRIVSTLHYNYNAVESGFDPETNRILHLKSGRSFGVTLEQIRAKLGQVDPG
jgi:hypothetical protein